MSVSSDLLPKVSLTDDDIVRIAETVKQLLKDDIEKTVERVVNEKQRHIIDRINDIEEKQCNLESTLTIKTNQLNELHVKTTKLQQKFDDLEQHSRKGLLRFSGVPFSRGENTIEKVVDIVKKIGVNIKADDISVSHRTGKYKENKPRQIIARFPKHDLKVEILKSAKKLREIPGLQNICINQDLTKTRDEIAFQARAYVRNHRLKATWVVDGKIMVIGKDNNKHAVTCMYDLNDNVFQSDNFTEINELEESEMQYASNGHDRTGSQFLNFTCLNTQSFLAKRDIIQAEFSDRDILLFTGTWFNQHTDYNDIKLESFNKPYRTDRNHKVRGGVAIYVKENIFSEEKPEFKINGLECVWVKIHAKGINILFGNFYRPPADSDNQIWEKINYSIDLAINSNADKIIICGDFNNDQLNHSKQKLREICNQNSLYQIITDAIYFCERSVSLLDLIMVNDPDIILYSEVGENILENYVRYHCPISAVINTEKQLTKSFKRKIWQYHLGDYDLFINELLKINWDTLTDNQNINTAAVNITEKILEAAEKSIPNKLVQSSVDDSNTVLLILEYDEIKKLEELIISEQDVEDVLVNLDISKATGPDLISPRLLRSASTVYRA
ncbi:unnamed protein product [Mytilus coruscus]|uniref:Endonuclease/exonuclease/phosphatase domain-containing protein n=1 Tax=Mytilus coruscus TaxID=42192 RepID=A0A6J8AI03_MYTCO|nr:unnamed protein product [Mytilus coruscus]